MAEMHSEKICAVTMLTPVCSYKLVKRRACRLNTDTKATTVARIMSVRNQFSGNGRMNCPGWSVTKVSGGGSSIYESCSSHGCGGSSNASQLQLGRAFRLVDRLYRSILRSPLRPKMPPH